MNMCDLNKVPLNTVIAELPLLADFFTAYGVEVANENRTIEEFAAQADDKFWEDNCINKNDFIQQFSDFAQGLVLADSTTVIESLEVVAGVDKSGQKEKCNLLLKPGEITCIVGPTGSGKSRLLADIEWLANIDTPTQRQVLINGQAPDEQMVDSFGGKLIAQITQNMNFVLDMDVFGFLMLHAQSKFLDNAEAVVNEVIDLANELSGEQFNADTPVTCLSGGQSRALMIADVACIGQAPIILIDEIENAGVDKQKALDLLISKEKIVLMATHDPILILLANKRVVIKNGGIQKVVITNEYEKEFFKKIQTMDEAMQKTRNFFRHGNELAEGSQLLE